MLGNVIDDARVAWRGLVRRPFYAVASIIMLALAIGANATAFSLFYGFLLRPLPYNTPSSLVAIQEKIPKIGLVGPWASPDNYQTLKHKMPEIKDAGLWYFGGTTGVKINGRLRAVRQAMVTPPFFRTLGVTPIAGRLLSLAAGRPDGPREALISYQFWQSTFGGALDAVGTELPIGQHEFRIVGVLPRRFGFAFADDVYLPLVLPIPGSAGQNLSYFMVARLASGTSLHLFDIKLHAFTRTLRRKSSPEASEKLKVEGFTVDALPIRKFLLLGSNMSVLAWLLQGTAGFLLILAIANAANLALVRHRARLHEFALRRVLGGSRGSLLYLLFLEQTPIFVFILLLGVLFAAIGLRGLSAFHADLDFPPFRYGFGWPVILSVIMLSVGSVMTILILPVMQTIRQTLAAGLGQGGKSTLSRPTRRIQRILGIVQIALACALLIGSAALAGSLYLLLTRPLGFSPDHRIVASIILPQRSNDPAHLRALVHKIETQPFTIAAAAVAYDGFPFSSDETGTILGIDKPSAKQFRVNEVCATRDFFRTLDIPLETGRLFHAGETDQNVVMLGKGTRNRLFGPHNPIGRVIRNGKSDLRIIGTTGSVSWRNRPWHVTAGTIYRPINTLVTGLPFRGPVIIIHFRGTLTNAMAETRHFIETESPDATVTSVKPFNAIIRSYAGERSLVATIVTVFAGMALILAALGVYAVNALIARSRLPEFGLRAMLGASPARLLRSALTDAAWLLGFGLAGGAMGGYLLIRAMSPLLYHVREIAPLVFAGSLILIAAIVLIAAWRPAATAANTPVKTLLDSA